MHFYLRDFYLRLYNKTCCCLSIHGWWPKITRWHHFARASANSRLKRKSLILICSAWICLFALILANKGEGAIQLHSIMMAEILQQSRMGGSAIFLHWINTIAPWNKNQLQDMLWLSHTRFWCSIFTFSLDCWTQATLSRYAKISATTTARIPVSGPLWHPSTTAGAKFAPQRELDLQFQMRVSSMHHDHGGTIPTLSCIGDISAMPEIFLVQIRVSRQQRHSWTTARAEIPLQCKHE